MRKLPWLAEMCRRIQNGEEHLKSRLPIWTPSCAGFRDNHRCVKDALVPLPRLMLDFDQKGHSKEILERCMVLKEQGRWDILLVEESVRHGTHVLIGMPEGMTVQQVQERFSYDVGFMADPALKDVARCIYMVPEGNTLFLETEIGNRKTGDDITVSGDLQTPSGALPLVPPNLGGQLVSVNGQGLSVDQLTDVAEELSHILAGGPARKGMRNALTYEVAKKMRHLTGDDVALLAKVIPQWESTPEKHMMAIENALRYGRLLPYTPQDLQWAMDLAMGAGRDEGGGVEPLEMACPALPERLPQALETMLCGTPAKSREAVLMALFPALRALMHEVKFQYIDNTAQEPCFLNLCIADQGSGKTALRPPTRAILHEVEVQDEQSRQEDMLWREQCAMLPSNKEKPKRPSAPIRIVQADMTGPALVSLMRRAGGYSLYTYGEELDKLLRLQGASEILRSAFDSELFGQERVGAGSVSDVVRLKWSFVYSTTPGTARRILGKEIANGTLSRLCLSTIQNGDDDWGEETPVYGEHGEAYRDSIGGYLGGLRLAGKRTVVCSEAIEWARDEKHRQIDRLKLMDAKYMLPFLWRGLQMAFWRACMLYLMHGSSWSREIEEFASWSLDYDMWVKMHYFGSAIEDASQGKADRRYLPTMLLPLLPETFTRDEARMMRRRMGKDSSSRAVRNMLSTWTHRGFIRLDREKGVYLKVKG